MSKVAGGMSRVVAPTAATNSTSRPIPDKISPNRSAKFMADGGVNESDVFTWLTELLVEY